MGWDVVKIYVVVIHRHPYIQVLKVSHCEYMEEEMREFMEKCVLPVLMTSNEDKPPGAGDTSIPKRNVLCDCLHEVFISRGGYRGGSLGAEEPPL